LKKLAPKQERFIEEYLKDLNATQAAIRAGYSKRTAKSQGQRLLTKADVLARIEDLKKERSEKAQVDADWVLQNLIKVADMAMKAEPVMTYDHQAQELVETGEYTFDSTGANKALELIGKHIGMFDPKFGKAAALSEAQISKIKAETAFIKERTKLIKGKSKDTSLLDALIDAVNDK
jgi:phage terminase small subunit